MFKYYTDNEISSIEVLANNFKDRLWYIPDFISDESLSKIKEHISDIEYFYVNDDLSWAPRIIGNKPKIFLSIDYFGKEFFLGKEAPPNTVIVRDGSWFPYPFSPVEHNHIWFNGLRNIIKGAKGSSIVSPYRLSGVNEVPNIYYHPLLTWQEMNKRFENYYHCKEILSAFGIHRFDAVFPSVFPIALRNRNRVLAGLDAELPELWKNKHHLPNPMYKELMLIPIDSRYNKESLTKLADKIKELNK